MKSILGALALIIAAPAAAQTAAPQAPMGQMDHSKMDHSTMDHSQHQQGQHDCKTCCEKMVGKDGKMECMDKTADAKAAPSDESAHEGHAH